MLRLSTAKHNIFIEKYRKLSLYYHQKPTLSVSLTVFGLLHYIGTFSDLKTEDWVKALTDTDRVLKLEPDNIKGIQFGAFL